MWKLAAVVGVLVALTTGCSSGNGDKSKTPGSTASAGSVRLLAPRDYQTAIAGKGVFVVNVHIPYDGEIEGTAAFIPYDKIAEHKGELPSDKSAPLYIYCRSGRMSVIATPDLQRLGYTNIVDLEGGMQAWSDAGLPLLDLKRRQ
jgi:rhodanese-related sulfurtransferase